MFWLGLIVGMFVGVFFGVFFFIGAVQRGELGRSEPGCR